MVLDINLLRKEKGFDPEVVRESERRRFRKGENAKRADEVIGLDELWRKARFNMDQVAKELNAANKDIGNKKKKGEDASSELTVVAQLKQRREELEAEERQFFEELQTKLKTIGNLVHESVLVSDNEDHNLVVRTWGKIPDIKVDSTPGRAHHHEILAMIDGFDPRRGSKIAGHRGYFLKGMGAILNMALVNYGLQFLMKRSYTPIQTPSS